MMCHNSTNLIRLNLKGFSDKARQINKITAKSNENIVELQLVVQSQVIKMKSVTLVAVLVGLVASASAMLNSLPVSPNNPAPYFARITYNTEANPGAVVTRAGSIVSDRFILTTNDIPVAVFDINVFVGSNYRARQRSIPGSAVIHLSPDSPYSPALVQLLTPLVFSRTVNMIRLYPAGRNIGTLNQQGFVVGNGLAQLPTPTPNLQVASLRITERAACLVNFPARTGDAFFCAFDAVASSDFCANDVGAGFTMMSRGEEVLVGVGVIATCNTPLQRPSLFASVDYYRDQIYEHIAGISTF